MPTSRLHPQHGSDEEHVRDQDNHDIGQEHEFGKKQDENLTLCYAAVRKLQEGLDIREIDTIVATE